MSFSIFIEPEALVDVQKAIDFYNEQKLGLGEDFLKQVNSHLKTLYTHPFFQIRYDNVRCLPVSKYPFMIHYTVDEPNDCVIVRAVLNTNKDLRKLR